MTECLEAFIDDPDPPKSEWEQNFASVVAAMRWARHHAKGRPWRVHGMITGHCYAATSPKASADETAGAE